MGYHGPLHRLLQVNLFGFGGDGSTVPTYRNWAKAKVWDHYGNEPNGDAEDIGDGKGLCVRQFNQRTNGEWGDDDCTKSYKSACSMEAEQSCQSKPINETETIKHVLQKRACLPLTMQDEASNLPATYIFLNPAKEEAKEKLIKKKKGISKNYFNESDMTALYPDLFRLLCQR